MSFAQDRWVLAALAMSESAWLFAVFGVLGVVLGQGRSPLGWIAVFAILGVSIAISRMLQMIVMPSAMSSSIMFVAGVLAIYLTVGTQVSPETRGIELGWLAALARGSEAAGDTFRVGTGSVLGLLLWWRGARLGTSDYPPEALEVTFKVGVLALATALIVDIASSADLHIFPMMFIFFAAGLGGLSVSRLLPGPGRSIVATIWAKVIGGVVGAILLAGLVFSLLRKDSLSVAAEPFVVIMKAVAIVIFYVFIIPAAFIIDKVVQALTSIVRSENSNPIQTGPSIGERLAARAGPTSQNFLHVVEWIFLAVIILLAIYILAKAFKRRSRRRIGWVAGTRESLREGADASHDLAQLALGLIPGRLRRRNKPGPVVVPEGEPGVVEALRLYYRMLSVAEGRGSARVSSETPSEYLGRLEQVFPRGLATTATNAFNRARYGRHAATSVQLEMMRTKLEELGYGPADQQPSPER